MAKRQPRSTASIADCSSNHADSYRMVLFPVSLAVRPQLAAWGDTNGAFGQWWMFIEAVEVPIGPDRGALPFHPEGQMAARRAARLLN